MRFNNIFFFILMNLLRQHLSFCRSLYSEQLALAHLSSVEQIVFSSSVAQVDVSNHSYGHANINSTMMHTIIESQFPLQIE